MTVTAGPEISMSDLHGEFGGTGPISDYYKDGGLVPSERAGFYDYGAPTDSYSISPPVYYMKREISSGDYKEIYWNGTLIASGSALIIPKIQGGYEYDVGTAADTSGDFRFYRVIRRTATWNPAVPINADVPTGGEVSLSDFYSSTAT